MIDGQKTLLIKKYVGCTKALCFVYCLQGLELSQTQVIPRNTYMYFSDSHIVLTCDNVLASSVYDLFYMKLLVYFEAGYAEFPVPSGMAPCHM